MLRRKRRKGASSEAVAWRIDDGAADDGADLAGYVTALARDAARPRVLLLGGVVAVPARELAQLQPVGDQARIEDVADARNLLLQLALPCLQRAGIGLVAIDGCRQLMLQVGKRKVSASPLVQLQVLHRCTAA